MATLRLFDEEELLRRVRPHPGSYLRHYLGAFGWLVAGGAGAGVAFATGMVPANWSSALGLFTVGLVAMLGGLLRRKMTKRGMLFAIVWSAVALLAAAGAGVAPSIGLDFSTLPSWWLPLAFGAAVSLVRLVAWETYRLQRQYFVTSERIVARAGIGHRHEETLGLKQIREVRSHIGPLGQLLGYGDLTLVRSLARGKEGREDAWVLRGIGDIAEVKHTVEQLLEESRMSTRERKRRVEERRLRESMRRLAGWMRSERTRVNQVL